MSNGQNFPPPSLPIVDVDGILAQPWFRLLLTLWNRTGGAQGFVTGDLAALSALTPAQDDQVRVMTAMLETAVYADRAKTAAIDDLAREVAMLKAMQASRSHDAAIEELKVRVTALESRLSSRSQADDQVRREVSDIRAQIYLLSAPVTAPAVDPYSYLSR